MDIVTAQTAFRPLHEQATIKYTKTVGSNQGRRGNRLPTRGQLAGPQSLIRPRWSHVSLIHTPALH